MCGIMGLYAKSGVYGEQLGSVLLAMLNALACRGPDSAGVALYCPRPDGAQQLRIKLGDDADWEARLRAVLAVVEPAATIREQQHSGEYLRLALDYGADDTTLLRAIEGVAPDVEVISRGSALDIVKQVGSPGNLQQRFAIADAFGSHAIAHTRLSTESKIDLSHSQPFWAHGRDDLATVHNGHITNYDRLRRQYEQRGVRFYTHNDSEVIGIYLAELLDQGATLKEALNCSVRFFDGSFSYLAATAGEIGYARDAFGFKPLIVAECEEFVAFATEEVALQALAEHDMVTYEPAAGSVGTWTVEQPRSVA